MIGVFGYLTLCTFRNRIVRQVTRLRSPRYLIGLLLGGGYIWFFLFRPGAMGGRPPIFANESFELFASAGLFILFLAWWVFGKDKSALAFSPAEVQFLFPAPVTRKGLIHFKLLRSQVTILLNTLIWILLFGRGGTELPLLLRVLGFWALFSTFTLHRLGAALVRSSSEEHGIIGIRRNIPALILFGSAVGALAWSVWQAYPAFAVAGSFREYAGALRGALESPVAQAVLLPFATIAAPLFAHDTAEWLRTFPLLLAIVLLHYFWVVRADTSFEEAAADASIALARRIATARGRDHEGVAPAPTLARAGGVRSRLPLAPTGPPAVAIVWKNLLGVMRTIQKRHLVIAGILLAYSGVISLMAGRDRIAFATIVAVVLMLGLLLLIAFGARMIRNDLRDDMLKLSLLKTYPLPGSTIVAAQVASTTIALTILQMLMLLAAFALTIGEAKLTLGIPTRLAILLAAPIPLFALNAATVTIQNAAALVFPAWVKLGVKGEAGIEALGQNLLTTLASMVLLALTLIIPLVVGAVAMFTLAPTLGRLAPFAALLLAVAALIGQVVLGLRGLGVVFDRTDPTAVT
jgi:ABC-2 type transport system permease protein